MTHLASCAGSAGYLLVLMHIKASKPLFALLLEGVESAFVAMLPLHVIFSAEPVEGIDWSLDNRICLKLCKLAWKRCPAAASNAWCRCYCWQRVFTGCRTAAFYAQDSEQAVVVPTQATVVAQQLVYLSCCDHLCARVSPAL